MKQKKVIQVRPAKALDVLSRFRTDGGVVIVKIACDKHFFQLDNMAAEFWSLIDGKKSVDTICSTLVKKHKPPIKALRKEVDRLISDLKKHDLIVC